eukprot:TRINITY_DN3738_c0_g1_i1.p1 TRINITY_DN3738_c0_g1~~TRINITY_DN3738_c0_g1_i1.p1  ORF type:complete len:238 (-),score=64.95 TRINITY_DN3738_c0_g1_i1:113-826(-)
MQSRCRSLALDPCCPVNLDISVNFKNEFPHQKPEKSSCYTFPDLKSFRYKRVDGWRRLFVHAALVFFDRGIAKLETKEFSSLSVEPSDGDYLIVSVFEIDIAELPKFFQREEEFHFHLVDFKNIESLEVEGQGIICGKSSDEEYIRERLGGSHEAFLKLWSKHGIDRVWRDDIFPCRVYLRHCLLAAKGASAPECYENFLNHTYLGDRLTTIGKYMEKNADIMEEVPPEDFKDRYNG